MTMEPDTRPVRFVHRLEYALVRTFAALVGVLPRGPALAMGRALGTAARRAGIRVAVARGNLARAFADRPAAEREVILREAYAQAGMTVCELLRSGAPDAQARADLRTSIRGLEHIAAARAGGRGAVLMTGHFGAYELVGAAMADAGHPVHYFVRAQSNPLVDRFVRERRRAVAGAVVGHGRRGVREVLAILSSGGCVAVLADQDAGRDGIFVDFFGRPASTPPGPAEFALRTGSAIVFGCVRRSPSGEYEGEVLPPFEPVVTGDHAADVRALTQRHVAALEQFIRQSPEQWLWTHRRWKTVLGALVVGMLLTLSSAAGALPGDAAGAPRSIAPESLATSAESVFDGAGSSVFPLEAARVRRLFEDVRVRRLDEGWAVEAEDWFVAGVAPVTAVMGLPDYRASLPAADRDTPERVALRGTLRDLVVTVDGLPMAFEALPGSAAPGEDLGGIERICRFAVPFAAEEFRSVRLSYRFGDTRTDDGEPLLFYYRNPGSLWEGESPKSTVSIDLGASSQEDLIIGWLRPLGYRLYGSQILWHRPAGEELADIALGLRAPADPLAAFADRAKGPLGLSLEAREEWFARLTVRDLRFFVAWWVARRGGPIPSEGPGAALADEAWIRADRGFREDKLPAEERQWLDRLRGRLAAFERARIPFHAGPPFVPDPGAPPSTRGQEGAPEE